MPLRTVTAMCLGFVACSEPPMLATREQHVVAPPELDTWIAAHQIPLSTAEAGHAFADLGPLAAQIGDARVVALGEATHGSREIFQLKHRLIEYLVTQRGFTTLAFEAEFPESLDVDDYVAGAQGDPARVIAGLGEWPWMTDEVVDLIEWMRAYNRTHARKVHFVGIDMQLPDRALNGVLAYLRRVDAENADRFAASLHMATTRYDFFALDPELLFDLQTEADALLALFDAQRATYQARSSAAEWTRSRQLARIVDQAIAVTIADFFGDEFDGDNVRDLAMADNISWILDTNPDSKVIVWAHNDHVSKGSFVPEWTNLGSHLDTRLGDSLRVIGSAFDAGEFQALNQTLRLVAFPLDSGGPETLDGILGADAAPIAVLPLGDIPAGPVADYFAAPPLHRDIGAAYLPDEAEFYFRQIRVADVFDALAFVAATTRARPTLYANDQINPQPTNTTATNLGFEDGTTAWFAPVANQVSGYAIATTAALPYEGHASAVLTRTPAQPYGKNYGELRQKFLAGAYKGQRVRLRAAVRAILAPGARVHMWMRAGGAYDGMHERPILTTPSWQLEEIMLDVPPFASTIQFGFVLVGDGTAWIDGVSFEVVPP